MNKTISIVIMIILFIVAVVFTDSIIARIAIVLFGSMSFLLMRNVSNEVFLKSIPGGGIPRPKPSDDDDDSNIGG